MVVKRIYTKDGTTTWYEVSKIFQMQDENGYTTLLLYKEENQIDKIHFRPTNKNSFDVFIMENGKTIDVRRYKYVEPKTTYTDTTAKFADGGRVGPKREHIMSLPVKPLMKDEQGPMLSNDSHALQPEFIFENGEVFKKKPEEPDLTSVTKHDDITITTKAVSSLPKEPDLTSDPVVEDDLPF